MPGRRADARRPAGGGHPHLATINGSGSGSRSHGRAPSTRPGSNRPFRAQVPHFARFRMIDYGPAILDGLPHPQTSPSPADPAHQTVFRTDEQPTSRSDLHRTAAIALTSEALQVKPTNTMTEVDVMHSHLWIKSPQVVIPCSDGLFSTTRALPRFTNDKVRVISNVS
jgi:hypothetical protein